MLSRLVAIAMLTACIASPPTNANVPLAITGGVVTGVGVLGSLISGIVWGVKAREEYCDTNSSHDHMITQTHSYSCTRCSGGKYRYCYSSTCQSYTNYCSDAAGDLDAPLTRREQGYDEAMYTSIGFFSLTGVGIVLLVTGLATN